MKMVPVKSTNITHIGHDGNVMHVTFRSGATYVYGGVTAKLFDSIANAKSVGSALAKTGLKGSKLETR